MTKRAVKVAKIAVAQSAKEHHLELSNQTPFEKPDAGTFIGKIIDVVDLPNYPTSFGLKNKLRIVWVLGKIDNTPALDSQGKPYQVITMPNASMNEKSTLFKLLQQILNGPPPMINNSEQLSQLLMDRANVLFLTKTPNPQKQGDFFVNVAGVAPLMNGQVAPATPAGYIRQKDRPAKMPGSSAPTQAAVAYQQPQAQAPASVAAASAPPQSNVVQF